MMFALICAVILLCCDCAVASWVGYGFRSGNMFGGTGFRGGVVALLLLIILACFVSSPTAYPLCAKNLGTLLATFLSANLVLDGYSLRESRLSRAYTVEIWGMLRIAVEIP